MSGQSMEQAYNKALKLLARRFHSVFELRRKLEMRGFEPKLIESTIAKLKLQDYLNDERFAQEYLDNLIKYKTFGFYGLKAKLMQRGIAKQEAGALLEEKLPIEAELEIAMRVVEKQKEPDKVKLTQKLNRKGFRSEVIREILDL